MFSISTVFPLEITIRVRKLQVIRSLKLWLIDSCILFMLLRNWADFELFCDFDKRSLPHFSSNLPFPNCHKYSAIHSNFDTSKHWLKWPNNTTKSECSCKIENAWPIFWVDLCHLVVVYLDRVTFRNSVCLHIFSWTISIPEDVILIC